MYKKIMMALLVLVLSFSLISCQNTDTSKDSKSQSDQKDTQTQKDAQEDGKGKKEENNKKDSADKKDDENKKNDSALSDNSKLIVYPLETDEIKKMVDYSFYDEGQKQDIKNKVIMRFPQVNLNSEDAEKFNEQMQKFAKSEYQRYQEAIKESYYWNRSLDYTFFENNEILSIVLYYFDPINYPDGFDLSEHITADVKTFNFDPKTGKLLYDEEVVEIFGIQDYEQRILGYINEYGQKIKEGLHSTQDPELKKAMIDTFAFAVGGSNTNFWRSFYNLEERPDSDVLQISSQIEGREFWLGYDYFTKNVAPQLYFDSNRMALKAFVKLNVPAEAGYYYENVDVNDLSPLEFQLNPTYEYYAHKLGIDVNDSNSPVAFSALLGYKMDENAKHRLQSLKDNGALDLEELIINNMMDYSIDAIVSGDEMFVLIPKYVNTATTLVSLQVTEEGKDTQFSYNTYVGNILLICNPSELRSNCEVQFNFKGQLIKYQPSISLKDGSNTVVDFVEDISPFVEDELSKVADEAQKVLEPFLPKG